MSCFQIIYWFDHYLNNFLTYKYQKILLSLQKFKIVTFLIKFFIKNLMNVKIFSVIIDVLFAPFFFKKKNKIIKHLKIIFIILKIIYNLAKKILIAKFCINKTLNFKFKCFLIQKLKNQRMQKFWKEWPIKKFFF